MAAPDSLTSGELSTFLPILTSLHERNAIDDTFNTLEESYNCAKGSSLEKNLAVDLAFRTALCEIVDSDGDCKVEAIESLLLLTIRAIEHNIGNPSSAFQLMSDLFDTVPVDDCKQLFTFVEDHVSVWKKDLFFSHGKNSLLRMCNDILKRLSKSHSTIFCGRIQVFLARFFPLSEKSALNLPSHFNLDNVTVFRQADKQISENQQSESMELNSNEDLEEGEAPGVPIDHNLYKDMWSLQGYFSNPAQCYEEKKYQDFKTYAEHVLSVFKSYKLSHSQSSAAGHMTESHDDSMSGSGSTGAQNFIPKYLTNEKLLSLQLSDGTFRRYVLVQFLIIFQYLEADVKFKNQSQVLKQEHSDWIKKASSRVYDLIKETPPHGTAFARTIGKVLDRENHWNAWKNASCSSFEKKRSGEVTGILRVRKRFSEKEYPSEPHIGVSGPKKPRLLNLGNKELSALWNGSSDNLGACKSKKRAFLPSIKEYFAESVEQDDPANGIEEEYKLIRNDNFAWRAVRLLCKQSPHFFAQSNTPTKALALYLQEMTRKVAKDQPSQQAEEVSADVDIKEEEIKEEEDDSRPATRPPKANSLSLEQSSDELPAAIISTAPAKMAVSVTQIEEISVKVKDQWEELAKQLKVREDEIIYVKEEAKDDQSRCLRTLTIWKESEGSKATQDVLESALTAVGLSGVISLSSGTESSMES